MKKIKLSMAAFAAMLILTACRPASAPDASGSEPSITIGSSESSDGDIGSTDMSEPVGHKVYDADDLAEYFNIKGEVEGIAVSYIEDKGYWYLHYIGEESDDESKDNLSSAIVPFLPLLPLYNNVEDGYLFRYLSKYVVDPEFYFVYVVVSSNHFAACSIYGYIEDNHLIADIIIYDGRNGLYM